MANRIVILGGGFAGVRCALDLCKKINKEDEIVLVNRRPYHVYRPDLYEVASAFYPEITETCKAQLSETAAIRLNKIFEHKPVRIIIDTVSEIDIQGRKVLLEANKKINYTYLIVALGSSINDYGIAGLKEHAHTLKTVTDALALCCHVDGLFYERWKENDISPLAIIIGGGGATGVEYACSLKGYVHKLAHKYKLPKEIAHIKIIEAGKYLGGQQEEGTEKIIKRLEINGITVERNARIISVEKNTITINSEKQNHTLTHSLFVWSGGVIPHPLIKKYFRDCDIRGGVHVNEYLQTIENSSVFACGDNAYIFDSVTQKSAPLLAQCAVKQGALVAKNIVNLIAKRALQPYALNITGIVIPLGKKFAILTYKNHSISGRMVWWLRRLIDLTYAMSILPWWYAFKKWFATNKIFAQND